ncbi:MAG: HAD-IB family hydrolase [Deltaproteobacteria bacterium]|nr:HAD-IB family hydrolase [Deltaproteobacteria bacterium]
MTKPIVAITNDLFFWAKIKTIGEERKIPVLQQTDFRKAYSCVSAKRPSAVFLDLEAPYLDPLGTILSLKRDPLTTRVPIVGYHGSSNRDLSQKAKNLGCDQVMTRHDFSQKLPELMGTQGASSGQTIAFFDVDRTLISGYSGFYVSLELIRRRVMKKRRLPLALFYQLTSRFQHDNVKKMYETACGDMAGFGIDQIMEIGRDCFEKSIRPRFYREALEVVEEHKRNGRMIVLLTSGPTMVVHFLADYLGVDQVYGSGPLVVKGVLEPEVGEPICYSEGKVIFAEQVEREQGVSLRHCYYYTDDITDKPLLEKVGFPSVVNPRRNLAKIAKKRGWPILRWSEVVGEDA